MVSAHDAMCLEDNEIASGFVQNGALSLNACPERWGSLHVWHLATLTCVMPRHFASCCISSLYHSYNHSWLRGPSGHRIRLHVPLALACLCHYYFLTSLSFWAYIELFCSRWACAPYSLRLHICCRHFFIDLPCVHGSHRRRQMVSAFKRGLCGHEKSIHVMDVSCSAGVD